MPLTARVAALRGRGGGAPLLPIAAGDAVREDTTGGVDGLESGRGILEGVSARSMRREVRMDERSGGAGKSEEEVLTWTGVSWIEGRVGTEEGTAAAIMEEGMAIVEEGTMVVEEGTVVVEEGTAVVEEGTEVVEEGAVVEAREMVCVFVEFSMLA